MTIGSPHWSLSQVLPMGLEGILAAKEKGALHRQHCFHSQQKLWSCLVGKLEVWGRLNWFLQVHLLLWHPQSSGQTTGVGAVAGVDFRNVCAA